jgi:hypothetical protein
LPEIAEDMSDFVKIISPLETPLLNHLGNPRRYARSILHEWFEDELLPVKDRIKDDTITNPLTATSFDVTDGSRFRAGDQIQIKDSREVIFVNSISTNTLMVTRGYGGTMAESLRNGQKIRILGNMALEDNDRPVTRFTRRVRKFNYTQIFTASIESKESAAELDHQKQERLRELLRDLENCVINGVSPASTPEGSTTVRRTMKGIIPFLATNVFVNNQDGFPAGDGAGTNQFNEKQLNTALYNIWDQSSYWIDTIVVNNYQKRLINSFIASTHPDDNSDKHFYEFVFGTCGVVLSRWVPADTVLLLNSSMIDVLPLIGRSFHYKHQASMGDREAGQVIGEYTVELRNERAHGLIRGLATS